MYFILLCTDREAAEKYYPLGLNISRLHKRDYKICSIEGLLKDRYDYKQVIRLSIPNDERLLMQKSSRNETLYETNMIFVEQIYSLNNIETVKYFIDLGVSADIMMKNLAIISNPENLKLLKTIKQSV
ncbi:putative ankyrin repeat protein [Cotonvirus japonicus]|uniref:Ankyrin repeat protein n=1 Tax=Cotonvirus japonicus TaxID=2811091 RepID=A0ABM7NR77_9VIRU|nr:putative ankyrin repeat protein [Cotonvirus japonicus]BCS82661.1 putative ankyrin repeat protein [Cotonvirus japonicus]